MDGQTERLLRKSAANERAIASRDLEGVPDVFGFQVQQAIEKLLKAMLTELGVRHRRTHDVAELVHIVETHDQPLPATPIPLSRLTAFAVEFRYEDVPGGQILDPSEARTTVAILREHVETRLRDIAGKRPPLA